jgi:hypothetical protein
MVPEPDGDIVVKVYFTTLEAVTLRSSSCVWMIWFDCATTVILYVPTAKLLDTTRCISAWNPGWPEVGENDTDSPWGAPVAERATVAGLPPLRRTDTTTLSFAPWAIVSELGVTARLNLKGWAMVDVAVVVCVVVEVAEEVTVTLVVTVGF